MTTVYWVRHGVHGLVNKELVGRRPGVALAPEGVAQVARLRDHFAGLPIDRVLSSPLQRTRETAAPLAEPHGLPVEVDDGLIEIDCGAWTGRSFEELAADPRWAVWNSERATARIPGGEAMAHVQRRAAAVMDRLLAEGVGAAILVSHADVIKAAIAGLIDMPLNLHDRIAIDPASITTVELWRPGAGRLVRMNQGVP